MELIGGAYSCWSNPNLKFLSLNPSRISPLSKSAVPKCISVTRLTFDTTFIAFKIIEMQTVIRPNIVHLDYAEEALHVCS